jgi:hypothetical protein
VAHCFVGEQRYPIKQAFIKSSAFKFRLIEVLRIGDGIASSKPSVKAHCSFAIGSAAPSGYLNIAEVEISELVGKSEDEILSLFNKRMDVVKGKT